uniref:DPH-type MB domain-containing protein n=1 Tax=Mola mola TaxID=94237 RepID=A0A3Q3X2P0_MOLML
MLVFHDEIEIDDLEYNEDTDTDYFRCPCGDEFAITEVNGRRCYQYKSSILGWAAILECARIVSVRLAKRKL